MIVTLDGRRLADDFPADLTLQKMIDGVRTAHLEERIIASVSIDGQELLDAELSTRLSAPVEGAAQIDLESADVNELAAEAFRNVGRQLYEARQALPSIAEALHAGRVRDAVEAFGPCLVAWRTCQQAIGQAGGLLERDLTQESVSGGTLGQQLGGLAEKLSELRDALDAKDNVLLADLIEYEMPDLCERWEAILAALAEQVTSASSAAGSKP